MAEVVTTKCLTSREILEQADDFLSVPGHWVRQDWIAWRPTPDHQSMEIMGACLLGSMVLVDAIDINHVEGAFTPLGICQRFIKDDDRFAWSVRFLLKAMGFGGIDFCSTPAKLVHIGIPQLTAWNDVAGRRVNHVRNLLSEATKLAVAAEEWVDG